MTSCNLLSKIVLYCKQHDLDRVLEEIKKQFDVVKIKEQNTLLGYTVTLVNVKYPNGVSGEIQVITSQMIYAKERNAKAILRDELYQKVVYIYYNYEDNAVKIENGRYFVKFKGGMVQEQFNEKSNLLCDVLLDVDKVYMTKEEYDKF